MPAHFLKDFSFTWQNVMVTAGLIVSAAPDTGVSMALLALYF
jgi:hypothetical protein